MRSWTGFAALAPRIAAVFERRHAAAGSLCLLGTLRSDGFPRISPMEPALFEDRWWLVGMPGTTKFRDLERDPRCTLHTATVDTRVTDGDAKLWGVVEDVQDPALHARFADDLVERTGMDLRGERFAPFFGVDVLGASCVEIVDGNLDITICTPPGAERVVRKH